MKPPGYYIDYGYKYCEEFNSSERLEKLSEAGKSWTTKVTVLLQEKLNQILLNNPDIELNSDLLEKKAFESHVEAYLEAGLLELPMSDKMNIFFTVDCKDLVKENGRQQVWDVVEAQILYYKSNPGAAVADATYISGHVSDIFDLIVENISRTISDTQTKGMVLEYTPQEVFDMLFGDLIKYYEDNIPGFEMPPLQ